MSVNSSYRIEDLVRHSEMPASNAYSFNIYLDKNFAVDCFNTDVSDKQEFFQKMAINKVLKPLYSTKNIHNPLSFVQGSVLVQRFKVLGDDTNIGFDHQQRYSIINHDVIENEEPIHYYCHNVDTVFQRDALLSLFLHWYDIAENHI